MRRDTLTTQQKPTDATGLSVPDTPLATRATLADVKVKTLAWGEPGCGKSRLALSFPKPLVVDLEKSTALYAGEFDFLKVEPSAQWKPHQLVYAIVKQIQKGMYAGEAETLVIDPITDYLDALEAALIERQQARGVDLNKLSGMAKTKAYAELNDAFRAELDKILTLDMHVVFVCRAKNLWGMKDGKMDVLGRQPDCKELVRYLPDLVLHMQPGGDAIVEKSRLGALPPKVRALTFRHIQEALQATDKQPAAPTPEPVKAKAGKESPAPVAPTGDKMLDAVNGALPPEAVVA